MQTTTTETPSTIAESPKQAEPSVYTASPAALGTLGVLIVIFGLLAVALPGLAALAADVALAWVALFAGVLQLVYAYQARMEGGVAWHVLSAVLTIAFGVLLLVFPLEGVMALALLFGALILAVGIAETLLALRLRPAEGWGWVLATGIVSSLAGVLLALTWPENAFWVLGLYVGVSLISGGVWRVGLALALHKRHQRQRPVDGTVNK